MKKPFVPLNSSKFSQIRTVIKSIPRHWIICFLSILVLWTLYITTFTSSTSYYSSFFTSINDFFVNERMKPLPIADMVAYRKTLQGRIGLEVMANTDVTFLGAAKNTADTLPHVLKQIDDLASYFRNSRAVFVEGDSTDNTKELLWQWANVSSHNRTIFDLHDQMNEHEKSGRFQDHLLPREGRIAEARNYGLAYIRKLPHTAYMIIIDLDQVGWDMSGIVDSFSRKNWDVMCSHGIFVNGMYRDSYAFRSESIQTNHHCCGDDHLLYNISVEQRATNRKNLVASKAKLQRLMAHAASKANKLRTMKSYSSQDHVFLRSSNATKVMSIVDSTVYRSYDDNILIPAKSCFGGLAIYRTEAIQGCDYAFRHKEPPFIQDCEHVVFHECIAERNNASRIYSNPFMKLWFGHTIFNREKIVKEVRKYIFG